MRLFKYLAGMYTSYSNIVYKNVVYQYRTRNQLCATSSYDFNLVINGVNINKYVNKLEEEYNILKQNVKNKDRYLEIEPAMEILKERRKTLEMIGNLNELLNDKDEEIRKLAIEEKTSFLDKITTIDKQLETALLNIGSVNNYDSIVLEVNSGVGGQEAMLFANELFKMYCGFIEYKGWNYEIAEHTTTDLGGIRHGSVLINGEDVFRYFQHEAGVHRVQRIPNTEKSGRIHTSTASVLALPQPRDIDISLQHKDLRIETKRASGAGGQHVNTTDSAVRITHLPSKISVECQVDRSQIRNREIALQRLRAKLYDMQLQKQEEEMLKTKKIQVKSNFRNEKIRTYNYSQDRITDHRLQQANLYNLKYFMQGNEMLENLINKLDYKSKIDNLLTIVDNLNKES